MILQIVVNVRCYKKNLHKCNIDTVGVACGQIAAVNFQERCFLTLCLFTFPNHVT